MVRRHNAPDGRLRLSGDRHDFALRFLRHGVVGKLLRKSLFHNRRVPQFIDSGFRCSPTLRLGDHRGDGIGAF